MPDRAWAVSPPTRISSASARTWLRPAAALAAASFIVGCAQTTDPAEGGFISGVSNLATGTYQQRIDQREATLQSLETSQQQLGAIRQQQARDQSTLDAQLAAARRQQRQVDSQLSRLRGRLANVSATHGATPQTSTIATRLRRLEAEANRIASQGPSGSGAARLPEISREIDELQRALDDAYGVGVGLPQS